ncbi:MAG: hypothetical protein M1828_004436 [Chrysothrix sp. TS-e1954]|nr:MAG: hypothetical protein M1828_004436 [Chrysothrix sp. TS-e1954]
MAQYLNSPVAHPGVRRSLTLPTSLQNGSGSGTPSTDAAAAAAAGGEILLSHPEAKIMSFTASMGTQKTISASTPEGAGTIPWTSTIERLEAAGPLLVYRIPGSVCFLTSGKLLLPLLPRSQCWCVDGASKFAMMIRTLIYRIELPAETAEDRKGVEEFRLVLDAVLKYEKTPCPFKRDFSVAVADVSPATPKRTQIPAAISEESSPGLRRSAGSVRRARKWEFDGVWQPEGYVKQSPSASPHLGLEESDEDTSSSQGPEEGAVSRKTSTTSRTDTEPSSPVRPLSLEKSRSVTAPAGLSSLIASDNELAQDEYKAQDEGPLDDDSSERPSPRFSHIIEPDTDEGRLSKSVEKPPSRTAPIVEAYEELDHHEKPALSAKSEVIPDTSAVTFPVSDDKSFELLPPEAHSPVEEDENNADLGMRVSADSSIQSFHTSQSATSLSSFHSMSPTTSAEDLDQSQASEDVSTMRLDAQDAKDMTQPPLIDDQDPPPVSNPIMEQIHETQDVTSVLAESPERRSLTLTNDSPSSTTPRPPQLNLSTTSPDERPPDSPTHSIERVTSPIDIPEPTIPPTLSPATTGRTRHSPTLRPILERRATSPLSTHPYYTGRRPSSPSSDLTNSLVSKTCALLLGPPSGLVAIMMQIAARIASGALRSSRAFRLEGGKLGYVPGRWEDAWGEDEGEDGRDDEGDEGNGDEAEEKVDSEDDVSSESDLFDDDDKDDDDVVLASGSPARARRRRWGQDGDAEKEVD